MFGCVRPKIFAVHSNIFRLHSNVTDRVMAAYTVNCNNISFKDKITEEVIIYYEFFKRGEIWAALKKALKEKNIQLLPQGETALNILAYRHLYTAVQVQKKQLQHYWLELAKEENEEENLYDKLKSCMLAKALEALNEIRFELFCSDSDYAREAKRKIEHTFEQARTLHKLNHKSSTYHKATVTGLNLARNKPNDFVKTMYNTKLPPTEYMVPVEPVVEEIKKAASISAFDLAALHSPSISF